MSSCDYNIDVLTTDENLFQRQIRNVLHNAVEGFQEETDVREHYWNINAAYHMLYLRLEKVYAKTSEFDRPDYTLLSGQLKMYVGILKCHLLSEDYRIMERLDGEVKAILLNKK